jgi:hypothetical protein
MMAALAVPVAATVAMTLAASARGETMNDMSFFLFLVMRRAAAGPEKSR